MISLNMSLSLNQNKVVNSFKSSYTTAQKWLDNEVLKDCDPYVPMDTGNLRNSGIRGTNIGSGQVIYNASYAAACYYGNFNFQKTKHPQACRQWFEKAKAACKDDWISGVKKLAGQR